MDQDTILNILGSGGSELEALKGNMEQLTGFLELVGMLDNLPDMDRRVSEDGLSLYHAISKEKEMVALETALGAFFGDPIKQAGEPLSADLADNLTIGYLGGVKGDQTLFLKKIGQGEMYGALFPWQRKVNVITVHLGLYNPVMSDDDYEKLENLVTGSITQRVSEEVESDLTGQVQGISLPSFLQMSEMEGSTCSLRISAGGNTGMLHLLNGNVIDAETGGQKHKEAAYTILSWDNPAIEILKAVGRTQNQIKLPLLHLLMDSLRQKDQQEFEKDAPPKKSIDVTSHKGKTTSPDKAVDVPVEEPAESAPAKIEEEASPIEMELEMSDLTVESDEAEPPPEKEVLEKIPAEPAEKPPPEPPEEDPKKISGKPIEALPPGPQAKEPEADDAIDDALIQKDSPGRPDRHKVDKTAIGSKPKKKFPMALVAGLAVLILCAAGYFIFLKGDSSVSDYQQLMTKVDQMKDADAQEKLLMDFINTHEPGEDTTNAELKLKEVWQQNEEANYQKTIDAVNKLQVDQAFEENARALYNRFLEKYPHTQHAADIQQAISEISGLSEDVIFSNLKNLVKKDYFQKIRSYENYLSLYPQGKYVESVKQMFSGALGESYMNFKREIAGCERAATWDLCLSMCDDYLSVFSTYMDTGEIQTIQNRIHMQKDYGELKSQVAGVDDDAARTLYTAYMRSYPDSSNNEEIKKEIHRMDQDVAAGRQWESLKKSMQGGSLSLQTKIDRIEKYISQNNTGPYTVEARQILKSLEKDAGILAAEREKSIKNLNEEERAKKEAEEQYAILVKRQAEGARIEGEKQKAIATLDETEGRFVLVGDSSVMDQRTKLMWSLIDSQHELGVCVDYRSAKRYVKELRHDGHDDWRLPTSAELAGIYKNKPYFPDDGAEWYWTSEIFAKGYSYIVNTVSAKHESVFKKVGQDVEGCGAVRAVRP